MNLFWQDIKELFGKYTENIIIGVVIIIFVLLIFHFFAANSKSLETWGEDYEKRLWFRISRRINLSDKPGTDEYGNSEETRRKYRNYKNGKYLILLIILLVMIIVGFIEHLL